MKHFTTDDGRILTSPKELEPLLKGSFPAFFNLLGHIRFFYVADEIWDGKDSLIFNYNDRQLAAITLGDSTFDICIGNNVRHVFDETDLNDVYNALKEAVPFYRRPKDQLDVDLDEYPNGIRCDLCLL